MDVRNMKTFYSNYNRSYWMINKIDISGPDSEGRRHALPQLPGAAAEEVGMRLAQVLLLQVRDMLGHAAAQMGTKRKNSLISLKIFFK